jgi:hypothetical protein
VAVRGPVADGHGAEVTTPAYVRLEMVLGRAVVDGRTDIHSLGLLYDLLDLRRAIGRRARQAQAGADWRTCQRMQHSSCRRGAARRWATLSMSQIGAQFRSNARTQVVLPVQGSR